MNKAAAILAAFDAGKLPTQQQTNDAIDWFLNSGLTQVEPTGESGALSAQGKILVADVRDLLTAYKQLGNNMNGDNVIQEALWHLSQADISSTSTSVAKDADKEQAKKDARVLAQSLRTLFRIVWTNLSSESESVFHDFASFLRLSVADAADYLSHTAGSAAESLREVDSQIATGDRNELGVRKQSEGEKADKDVRERFESGMDTVKDAGSKAIGVGQNAVATTEDLANRTSERFHDAFYKICDRAQDDEEYHKSISSIFDVLHKWILRSLDAAGDVTDTSLETFIDDPTPEKHLINAIRCMRTFFERLAGNKSLDNFFAQLRACGVDIQRDEHLRAWFDELLEHLRRSIDERGYARSEEALQKRKDLKAKWKTLHSADTPEGRKWREHFKKLRAEGREFQKVLETGEDAKRIRRAQAKLSKDIEESFMTVASAGAESGFEMRPWMWQDLLNTHIPRLVGMIKDIPIPRTEYKDNEVEFVLEDLDISSFSLLPGHAYIRNITDIDIRAPAPGQTSTAIGSLTRVYIQGVQLALREVSFYYKDKTATIGPEEYTGLLEFTLPPEGIDIDVVVRVIPNSPEGLQERQRRSAFQEIQRVDVKVSENMELTVKDCNHGVIATLFKPVMVSRFRETLQTIMAENIRAALEWSNSVVWDIGNRAVVFEDAGLGRGPSLVAGFWSELGNLQKAETGLFKGWEATGSGLVKAQGNPKEGSVFAMGAEPQVIPGNKHGPKATFSEPLGDKFPEIDADRVVESAEDAAKDVAAEARSIVREGVQEIKTFAQTVREKAEEEKRKPGWQSDAFNVKC